MADANNTFPASLKIDYPEKADRLTSFFRLLTIIPILIVLVFLFGSDPDHESMESGEWVGYGVGIVFIPTMLMILFRKKYPRWWFDWNLALTKFTTRVFSYFLLLSHEYPSTDEDQSVHIEIHYPDVNVDLHRGMPLVKWFLAIPHFIVLFFLYIGVLVTTIIVWFAILFSGKNPIGMFNFVVGVLRWSLRVNAYYLLLTTDHYPPFRLRE